AAHVLVVDDNADMREHLMRVLGERWRVTAVADGAAAMAALARDRFDLVLTDVMMPRMDGFALLRALKADPAAAQLPVVMLSARAGEEARVEGLAAGADDYVVKPFAAAQLIAQVQAQLTVQRARRESALERERLLAQEQAARREAQSQREEMARLRREAEAANRAKDQFLAMLGHELRNPLAPVVTALRLLRLRGHQSAELEILERQAGHLTRLVDDLLDVSRITRGKVELRKCRLEIAQAVDKAVELAYPLLEQNRQRVDTQGVARAGLAVEADPHRLAQIIANLLMNAAKYSEPGQHIALRGERVGERVTLAVRDHGFGIAPDMLERIFEVFVQQPQTMGRAAGGLGVGLAIARNLAQLHGGRLDARSDGAGKGSEFVLELPAAGAASALPAPPPEELPAAAEGKRVLVVDDNVDAAVTLRELLQLLGHTVQVVHNGAAGLEQAHRFAPDVALVDIGLPGYEVARRLRQRMDEGGPRMLMVAVTGYGLRADRELSAAAGFDFHLVKPIDLAALGAVLGMAAGAAAAAK
ncbi:MAG TPA: response regulator, partial [Burkholderiaceae bacterium]|nr:response regulator [Burkholderiaceae bacterium]